MKTYMRTVSPSPIVPILNGECQMGTYNSTFHEIDLSSVRRPLGRWYPKWFENLRLKEWEAFQVSDDRWFICLAVSNMKMIGIAFIFLYDKVQNRVYEYMHKGNASRFHVPSGIRNSICYHYSRDLKITIRNRLDEGRVEIEFAAAGKDDRPSCRGKLTGYHQTEPIVILQPFAKNRPLYSHKALMPADGELFLGEEKTGFTPDRTALIIDDHKGYYPFKARYDWLTSIRRDHDSLIGFNLTDNQVQDPDRYNENCLWSGGKMIPLPPVSFMRPHGMYKEWKVTDAYGMVDLRFCPLAGKRMFTHLGILKNDYFGPFGKLTGMIDTGEQRLTVDGWIGMGERRDDRL